MDIGRVGIWTSQLDYLTAPALRDTVQELEGLGYGALWFGENIGREPLTQAGLVLAATDRIGPVCPWSGNNSLPVAAS